MFLFKLWRLYLLPLFWYRWYKYVPLYDLETAKTADVIIALTFGIGPNGEPGVSNEEIAYAASYLHRLTDKPIIAQKEVFEAIQRLAWVNQENMACLPGPNEKTQGMHYHSADSLHQADVLCHQRKWGFKANLVGNADHMPRVHWAWQKLGGSVVCVQTKGIGYYPDSTQRWCRGKRIFRLWELCLAIPAYVLQGKI